jgi:MFS family permease
MPRLRDLALDVGPLRHHRDFRLLMLGQIINNLGSMATQVALPYQLYVITRSPLALGTLAALQLAAILIASPLAGALADTLDRRRMLLTTQVGLCAVSSILALLAFSNRTAAWNLFTLAFVQAIFDALDRPARQSMFPRMVDRERLSAALAIHRATQSLARVLGPAFGGILIAALGVPAAYAADAVTFVASFATLLAISQVPPLERMAQSGFSAIREGLAYVRRAPVVLSAFVVDLDAMIFGMPTALFPILALDVFHIGPAGLGLITAAPSAGAIIGLLTSGWVHRVRFQGRVVLAAVAVWGLAISLFGLVGYLPLALLLLALAGAADVYSAVLRATIIQLGTPDRLRGRVSSLNSMVTTSGPKMGGLESTTVAALTSAQFSVVSGGLLCLLGLAFAIRRFPELVNYDATRIEEPVIVSPAGVVAPAVR